MHAEGDVPVSEEELPVSEDAPPADDAVPAPSGGASADDTVVAVGATEPGAVEPTSAPSADPGTTDAEPAAEPAAPRPEPTAATVEALLFAAGEPLTVQRVAALLDCKPPRAQEALDALERALDERGSGLRLAAVAGGYQLRTRSEHGVVVRRLVPEKPAKLSRPALETLVVVAYRQPVTRAEIEEIRRVDTGAVLKTLLDRDLVRIVGRKDVPGRPVLYGTTREFLEVFGFRSLKDLPTLREIQDVAAQMGESIELPADLFDPAPAAGDEAPRGEVVAEEAASSVPEEEPAAEAAADAEEPAGLAPPDADEVADSDDDEGPAADPAADEHEDDDSDEEDDDSDDDDDDDDEDRG